MRRKPVVLCINPYLYDFAAYDLWIKPLGLLYLAAVLEENGCEVRWLDALDRWDPDVLNRQARTEPRSKPYGDGSYHKEIVEKPAPFRHVPRYYSRYGMPPDIFRQKLERLKSERSIDFVLVTSGMTYWYRGVHEAIAMTRSVFPESTILLGGIYATLFTEYAKKFSGADLVFRGEGERPILDWIADRADLPRKTYLGYDDYPFPAYHHYKRLDYVAMMTSRGCPYTCSFCATHEFTDHFTRRSVPSVLDELRSYAQRGIRNVTFYDDALFVNSEKHIKPILRSVIEEELPFHFHTPNGLFARLLDRELAELLVESGFKTVRLSYETKNPERQNQMRKVSDTDLERALTNLEKAGFPKHEVVVYLIMGLPGQAPDEVSESIAYVNGLGARVSLSSFTPIPGTREWSTAVSEYGFPAEEPLLTNKSVYPMRHAGFTIEDFESLKQQAISGNRDLPGETVASDYHVYA